MLDVIFVTKKMYDNDAYTAKERKKMTTPPWYAAAAMSDLL